MEAEKQKRIAENRAKALAKIQARKNPPPSHAKPVVQLTEEQKARIEANRQRALERQRAKQNGGNLRDAQNAPQDDNQPKRQRFNPPSIKKSDYIEFDLSTMKDSYGGFINDKKEQAKGPTLEEWQSKQERFVEPPPPVDVANAPKCFECGSMELDHQLLTVFSCRVCNNCKKKMPEKYSLLTKTECKDDYFLTDPELRDESLLPHLEKKNPYSGTYSRMMLFLRYQVEEHAFKKWGGDEGLDNEWVRRETQRVKKRDKKFQAKLLDMRKRTRAEEYTRKLRKATKHEHAFSAAVKGSQEGMVKRRCMECGLEIDEFLM